MVTSQSQIIEDDNIDGSEDYKSSEYTVPATVSSGKSILSKMNLAQTMGLDEDDNIGKETSAKCGGNSPKINNDENIDSEFFKSMSTS